MFWFWAPLPSADSRPRKALAPIPFSYFTTYFWLWKQVSWLTYSYVYILWQSLALISYILKLPQCMYRYECCSANSSNSPSKLVCQHSKNIIYNRLKCYASIMAITGKYNIILVFSITTSRIILTNYNTVTISVILHVIYLLHILALVMCTTIKKLAKWYIQCHGHIILCIIT